MTNGSPKRVVKIKEKDSLERSKMLLWRRLVWQNKKQRDTDKNKKDTDKKPNEDDK